MVLQNNHVPRTLDGLNVSAIVPAYNEAKNIRKVLGPLKQVSIIREIIVVSDGSTDDTTRLAEGVSGVKVLALPQNVGKTRAVIRGVKEAKHSTILLCDADLVNLHKDHIWEMIHKYCEGFDMVIMDKGSQPWVFKSLFQSVPAVSGTRILDRGHLLQVPFRETDRFQFEIRVNDYFLGNGLRIGVSRAEEIHDTRKYVKYPFWRGLTLDLKGGMEILASDGPSSIVRNLANFRRIRKLAAPPGSIKEHGRDVWL